MDINDNIMILGDFNLSSVRWKQNSSGFLHPDSSRSSINTVSCQLLDGYSTAGLVQMNGVMNSNGRLLDLAFVSNEILHATNLSEAPAPLVKQCRHHPPLTLALHAIVQSTSPIVEETYYNYKKADYPSMNRFLSGLNWNELLLGYDVNGSITLFSNVLLYSIDQYVPKRTVSEPRHPAWSNPALKKLKSKKRRALRIYTQHRTIRYKRRYSRINNTYKRLNKKLYYAYQTDIQEKLKSNPKKFWQHVNDQRKESGLPSTMFDKDCVATSIEGIAEMFRSQFRSVFVDEQLSENDVLQATSNLSQRPAFEPIFQISSQLVETTGKKLKISSNPGPDGIPSVVLRNCISSVSEPLATIFNLSIANREFPRDWKNSYVFPVFKKGNKRDVSNYRGIASLSATSKLFEKLALEYVMKSSSNLIADEQHGFTPKRSTLTNLVAYTSSIIREMENGNQTDAIYTDFSAAFDKINHQIAVAKLALLGFSGNFLGWIESYLTDRSMAVKIGSHISSSFKVTSGVPQGSHLGPFIFLLYLNDVNFLLSCFKLSFADDFKLYSTVKCAVDAEFLQDQLNIFAEWCKTNRMILNPSKCSVITFSRKQQPIHHAYELNGIVLKREVVVKDLGVMLDSKLTFKDHLSYVISKASAQLGFIFRVAKPFKDVYCLKALYCALVRSILEYGSIVWAPFYQNGIQRIEAVQKKLFDSLCDSYRGMILLIFQATKTDAT